MALVIYDGSFEGLLTGIFEVYEYKFSEVYFAKAAHTALDVFQHGHTVTANQEKAARVWKGLQQYVSADALHRLYCSFLSEIKSIENNIFLYIQYAFSVKKSIETDFSHPAVLCINNTAKQVHREKHRMEAFVRFQLTKDNLYYAVVEPDFDVLPLITTHFEKRFADQRWMIYDAQRKYGIYYDLVKTTTVEIYFEAATGSGKDISCIYDENEMMYQSLWQHYFKSVNIKARKNMPLHIRHMPKRYWKYLPEKRNF